VSPSWRNRLYIAFSPERISLLKLGRGLKPRLQARHDEAIAATGMQPSWQAALDRLTQLLGEPEWMTEWQGTEVNIVLSNRLVRYAAIPFRAQLKNYPEQEAFARYFFTQIFGAVADTWALRIQHGKTGSPGLVSAVDHALLEGLRLACATHKFKLHSITPYLMPVFNTYHKAIKSNPAWLVINEPGYSLLALSSGGGFVTVNGVCHDSVNELPILLDRENLLSTLAEPCKSVYLHGCSADMLSAKTAMGYEFSKLEITVPNGFPSATDGLYAMAMSGVL
jgi:hypothetical protein